MKSDWSFLPDEYVTRFCDTWEGSASEEKGQNPYGATGPYDCSNLGENEKKIHRYLEELSRSIGFSQDEVVSLYDLVGILSTPQGIVGTKDDFTEHIRQSFVYTKCKKYQQVKIMDKDVYKCCLKGLEYQINESWCFSRVSNKGGSVAER